jgi:hypothetical protein
MSEEAKERTMKDNTKALAWYRRALVAAGVMALLIGAHALAAPPPRIEIKDFKYGPPILSVPVGSTLTWVKSRRGARSVRIFGRAGQLRLIVAEVHLHTSETSPSQAIRAASGSYI